MVLSKKLRVNGLIYYCSERTMFRDLIMSYKTRTLILAWNIRYVTKVSEHTPSRTFMNTWETF